MLAAGGHDRAAAMLDRALGANEEPDVRYYLAKIWRLRGECLLAQDRGNKAGARRAFATAREVAPEGRRHLRAGAAAPLAEVSDRLRASAARCR